MQVVTLIVRDIVTVQINSMFVGRVVDLLNIQTVYEYNYVHEIQLLNFSLHL